MLLIFITAIATTSSLPVHVVTASETQVNIQNVDQILPEGVWSGRFLERDWTFEFNKADGNWSGKYRRSDGTKWLPLNDLVVSGRSVVFSIESKPKVSFSLEVDTEKSNMAGTVNVDGVATVPFSAARVP
jgi:hypothetical protein